MKHGRYSRCYFENVENLIDMTTGITENTMTVEKNSQVEFRGGHQLNVLHEGRRRAGGMF